MASLPAVFSAGFPRDSRKSPETSLQDRTLNSGKACGVTEREVPPTRAIIDLSEAESICGAELSASRAPFYLRLFHDRGDLAGHLADKS